MNQMDYTKEVLKHFLNPKNLGKLKKSDGVGQVKNPLCGDTTKIYIKVVKEKSTNKEYIKDIKFETLGCAAAISTSSVATELVKGKILQEAKKIKTKDILDRLKGLPSSKVHCSIIAVDALRKAIENYESKKKKK